MKLTAVIICRFNSSRLKGKHFKTIGKKYLISHTIDNLLKIDFIDEIYIASGKKKNNFIFRKKLSKLYPKIKFYFHKNEKKVVERITFLSKKIKNNNLLTISGDCPIISKNFIKKTYLKFKNKNVDFLIPKKKLQHEGIFFSKKKIWYKINKYANSSHEQEHLTLYLKKNLKRFNYDYFPYSNQDLYKGFRMSVDTQSDLDFFNIVNQACVQKNLELNYENIVFFRKYKFLNNHVNQKKENFTISKNIYILTSKNNKIGLGHYKRSLVIKREIQETLSIIPKLIILKDIKRILQIKKIFLKLKFKENSIFIFDLPNNYFTHFSKIKTSNPKILIDLFSKGKKNLSLIPSIRNSNNYKYQGENFLILDRNILYNYHFNLISKKKKIHDFLFLMGGTYKISNKILVDIKYLSKYYKTGLIVGPFVKKDKINLLKSINNLKLYINPSNYINLVLNSNKIISRFGNSVNEVISMNKKPWIYLFKENIERKKDINYLIRANLAFRYRNINEILRETRKVKKIDVQKRMVFGGKNVISVIKNLKI